MNYNEWNKAIDGSSNDIDLEFSKLTSDIELIHHTGIYIDGVMKIGACASDINHIITNWNYTIDKKGDLLQLKKLISTYDLCYERDR